MAQKPRLDELLVQRGFFASAHEAAAACMAGEVVVGEHRETSAGRRVKPDTPLRVKGHGRFVSRGGEKLAGALAAFPVSVKGANCIDLGCSSGGFTDCLLQHGAAHVSAVDVGYGQFNWALRTDARVSLYERTNVHGLAAQAVEGPFGVAVADLSFISLTHVFADVVGLLKPGGVFISLVKPQFEVAKAEVGEGGVVRSAQLHERVLAQVLAASGAAGLPPQGLTHSPIKGPKGNIEFLYWARMCAPGTEGGVTIGSAEIARAVARAHNEL